MLRCHSNCAFVALLAVGLASASARATAPSPAEAKLSQAAAENKFAFVVFYKQNDAATQKVAKNLGQGVAGRADSAVVVYVNVAHAAEKALVDKHKMARAPLPMTLAIAPNGAITGVFDQRLEMRHVGEAIVSETTAACMKLLQEGKAVLLCVHPPTATTTPAGVAQFHADAEFKDRSAVVSVRLDDQAEATFLKDLEIDAARTTATTVVFMAPPGVMVGKYDAQVTKAKLAADLHAAGKCCNDPNCKHAKGK